MSIDHQRGFAVGQLMIGVAVAGAVGCALGASVVGDWGKREIVVAQIVEQTRAAWEARQALAGTLGGARFARPGYYSNPGYPRACLLDSTGAAEAYCPPPIMGRGWQRVAISTDISYNVTDSALVYRVDDKATCDAINARAGVTPPANANVSKSSGSIEYVVSNWATGLGGGTGSTVGAGFCLPTSGTLDIGKTPYLYMMVTPANAAVPVPY